METDISQMEAPTFTTIDRSNPAPMLALDWDHKVNLVGKKVMNPMIHCCDKCLKPILIYGRMIPCKHVFCLGCAKQEERTCPRCGDKVNRVEQAGLGNIFLCTQGGSRYGNNGCRRTYLSSRDLSAHIAHRHNQNKQGKDTKDKPTTDLGRNPLANISKASLASVVAAVNSANISYSSSGTYGTSIKETYSTADHEGMNISVLAPRGSSNLITIHAQAPTTNANPQPTPSGFPAYPLTQGQSTPGYVNYGSGGTTTQGGYPNLSQPPPAYTGQYGGANPGQYGQYSNVYGAAQGSQGGQPYPPQPPTTPANYQAPSQPPAGGYQGGTGTPQGGYQGQWNRPPPQGSQPGNYYRR